MRIQLPKPLHGWRQFAGEVGIVVLGVLIALGAGQLAEEMHWRLKAAEAQESIARELAQNAGVFDERTMELPCQQRASAQLDKAIGAARQSGRLGLIEGTDGPAYRPLVTAAWESAVADGTSSHLSRERREMLGIIYPILTDYRRYSEEETQLWQHLHILWKSPGRISDAMLADAAGAAEAWRVRSAARNVIAEQLLAAIQSLGIEPSYNLILDREGKREEVLALHQRTCFAPSVKLTVK